MKKKNIVYTLVAVAILLIFGYSLGLFSGSEAYAEKILKERRETDSFMKRSSESPLSQEQKKTFKGLSFFAPDAEYIVNAKLTPFQNKTTIKIPTSDNKEVTYIKYGIAEFTLKDSLERVLLLQAIDEKDPKALFLAFTDKSSGYQTYGGGRYIDLKLTSDRRVIIDFNKAYNPYCMYNENYSCPFPPKENHLEVSIFAGEKLFQE